MQPLGKYIVLAGLVIVGIGLVVGLAGNKLNWFGQLPGDIRINRPSFKFFAPITSMLLVSLVINIIIWIIRKFF